MNSTEREVKKCFRNKGDKNISLLGNKRLTCRKATAEATQKLWKNDGGEKLLRQGD